MKICPEVLHCVNLETFRACVRALPDRGVRVLAYSLMPNHLHLFVVADDREALGDAMRYLFSKLARALQRLAGRRGRVFSDRYFSVVARSVRQAWITLNYVLFNAGRAGIRWSRRLVGWDDFTGIDTSAMANHRFLRSVFGPDGPAFSGLALRMARAMLPYRSVPDRLQLGLGFP